MAHYVAEIKVTSITETKNPWTQKIRFKVLNTYKGESKPKGAFVFVPDACYHVIEPFELGKTTMVFLSNERWSVLQRDPFSPHTKSDVIKYIMQTKQPLNTK